MNIYFLQKMFICIFFKGLLLRLSKKCFRKRLERSLNETKSILTIIFKTNVSKKSTVYFYIFFNRINFKINYKNIKKIKYLNPVKLFAWLDTREIYDYIGNIHYNPSIDVISIPLAQIREKRYSETVKRIIPMASNAVFI